MKSPKFPIPSPIDWTKYIEPMYQDFETKSGVTTAVLLTKKEYGIRNIQRQKSLN
jgi:hypothetical protein